MRNERVMPRLLLCKWIKHGGLEMKIWGKIKKYIIFILPFAIGAVIGFATSFFRALPSGISNRFPAAWAVIVISLLLAFVTGIIVHEVGHLVGGLLTGWAFLSLRIGPFVWFRENGLMRFRFSPSLFAGECLMKPVEDEEKFKFLLYNMGGVFGNLFLCVIAGVFLMITNMWFITMGMWMMLVINLIFAVTNALPFVSGEAPTDGANIREAMKSKRARMAFHKQFYINSEIFEGKRYRDFDPKIFHVGERAAASNYLIASLVMLEAEYWFDIGAYEKAVEAIGNLDPAKLPAALKKMAKIMLLYHYSCIDPDSETARALYEDDGIATMLSIPMPQLQRTRAAYEFFVLQNENEALSLLEKARKGVQNLPRAGERTMELDYLDHLEKNFANFLES